MLRIAVDFIIRIMTFHFGFSIAEPGEGQCQGEKCLEKTLLLNSTINLSELTCNLESDFLTNLAAIANQEAMSNFSEKTTKTPNCNPTSFPCGKSCQSAKTKTGKVTQCKNTLQGQAANCATWLHQQGAKKMMSSYSYTTTATATISTPKPKIKTKPSPKTIDPHATHSGKPTYRDVIDAGANFAKPFELDRFAPTSQELQLLKEKRQIGQQLKDSHSSKQFLKKYSTHAEQQRQRQHLIDEFKAKEKAHLAVKKKREKAAAQTHQQLLDAIVKENDVSPIRAQKLAAGIEIYDSVGEVRATGIRKDLADLFQLTGGQGMTSVRFIGHIESRASATPEYNEIDMGDPPQDRGESDRRTLFHEVSHHIEAENDELRQIAVNWRNSRASSLKPQKLNEIEDLPYDDSEMAVPDKFITPYVGKIYGNDVNSGETEVLSMGIERFSAPILMHYFYRADPEHFHLILGTLLNQKRQRS